jgi:hypothetical protein
MISRSKKNALDNPLIFMLSRLVAIKNAGPIVPVELNDLIKSGYRIKNYRSLNEIQYNGSSFYVKN